MKNKNLIHKLLKGKELTLEEAKKLGNTKFLDKKIPIKYLILSNQFIGDGAYGGIYPVRGLQGLVAKVPTKQECANISQIYGGAIMQKMANKTDLNIPESFGLFNVYDIIKKEFSPGHVMEMLNGNNFTYLNHRREKINQQKFEQIQKDRQIQLRKANELFDVSDVHGGNTFYDFPTQKTYLIDLDGWNEKNIDKKVWARIKG